VRPYSTKFGSICIKCPGNDLFDIASRHISRNSSMICFAFSTEEIGRYSTCKSRIEYNQNKLQFTNTLKKKERKKNTPQVQLLIYFSWTKAFIAHHKKYSQQIFRTKTHNFHIYMEQKCENACNIHNLG
jgi:hypothetical protein